MNSSNPSAAELVKKFNILTKIGNDILLHWEEATAIENAEIRKAAVSEVIETAKKFEEANKKTSQQLEDYIKSEKETNVRHFQLNKLHRLMKPKKKK